jgi:hypothetical protein
VEPVVMLSLDTALPSGARVTVAGLNAVVGKVPAVPETLETLALRVTSPENRLKPETVTLDTADFPGTIVWVVGLALIVRYGPAPSGLHAVRVCSSHPA